MLVSLCAVCTSTLSVSAAQGGANAQALALAGASFGGAPAVCAQNTNSIDLFVKGTDGALWYKHWDGTKWSPTWASIGGVLTSDPAATSSATGHIGVFVRGSGGALGGTGSWYNDAVGGANLGNTASDAGSNASAKTVWLDGAFFVYLQYNSIVDFSSQGSWHTDEVRDLVARR